MTESNFKHFKDTKRIPYIAIFSKDRDPKDWYEDEAIYKAWFEKIEAIYNFAEEVIDKKVIRAEAIKHLKFLDNDNRLSLAHIEQIEILKTKIKGLLKIKAKVSSFGHRKSDEQLKVLFQKLQWKILHDDTTESEFVNVFGRDWDSNESSIKFTCTIAKVAALIDILKPEFTNLNRPTAGESQKFRSSTGNSIDKGNFDSSFSKSKNDDKAEIRDILN